MATVRLADVVFCIDASNSMLPCFGAVCEHLNGFLQTLQKGGQQPWYIRLDYLAHSAGAHGASHVFDFRSLYSGGTTSILADSYGAGQGRFFTSDPRELAVSLCKIQVGGDEAPLVALDFALDFPWRDDLQCRRVVVMLTDEPL